MVLAGCDGFDVFELYLSWEIAVLILAASQLPINTVAESKTSP
jgi:hypothetical protein